MSYASILQNLPEELRLTMLELVEAVEQNLRDQLAVRREDFDALRATVRDLAEAQKRTEQQVEALAEAQKRTESRLDRLEAVVTELAEAQKRTEQRVGELAEAIRKLTETQIAMQIRLDRLVGDNLERKYRERAFAYFGRLLRRIKVVSVQDIEDELEGRLSDDEIRDLALLDVLLRGNVRQHPDIPEVWLALEVSAVVDRLDVERALRRAELLQKAGYVAIPVAAGEEATAGGEQMARANRVLLVRNGRQQFWEEALNRVLSK
ncbi:MAG TPA: hypothetical protein DEP84_09425 [Chloroflexi bacterium]|nr:hypothetical protein [Chloroflexota bacterium]